MKRSFLHFALFIMPSLLLGQNGSVYENLTIRSDILNTDKKYAIYLPAGYDTCVEAAPRSVVGGARQLRQAVINLVGNAIEHNRQGDEVHVTVAKENQHAVLTASDNGPGIHPDNRPRIFDRFYRADKSRSSADGHPGLGLAICKVIVEAHGGSIEVSSQVEEGSAFIVRLPAG